MTLVHEGIWSEGGYIGTVGEGITAEIIRNCIENQGTVEEKEGFEQMSLLDFK
jgi:putative transposase